MIAETESERHAEAAGRVPVTCWADTILHQSLNKDCQQTPRGSKTQSSNCKCFMLLHLDTHCTCLRRESPARECKSKSHQRKRLFRSSGIISIHFFYLYNADSQQKLSLDAYRSGLSRTLENKLYCKNKKSTITQACFLFQ